MSLTDGGETPPMRVAQLVTTLARGGAQATVLASAALPGEAIEVEVLAGTSPSRNMAAKVSLVSTISSTARSAATTWAPRRAVAKAWRPKPAPRSRTRMPGSTPSRS